MTLPTGSLVTGPDDLIAVHSDGDLWLHSDALTGTAGPPVRLADFTDPRIPFGPEGSGPNQVEDIAGVVDGVLYYSDCCEPVSGDLLAATGENSERISVGAGFSPALSSDRTRLATVNNMELGVIELASGHYRGLSLNDSSVWIEPWDLVWAADGSALVVLDFADTEWRLTRFAVEPTLALGVAVELGVPFDAMSDALVQLPGWGPNGEIAVVVSDSNSTVLRFFDATTLAEITELQRNLSPGIRSVRLADDGLGTLWIDGTSLRYLPAAGETVDLGDGFVAAWFA